MSTQQLLALDLLLVVLGCALFLAAGFLTLSLRSGSGWALLVGTSVCAVLALLVTVARVVLVIVLGQRGWWFVGEKVTVAVPLAVLTAGFAAALTVPVLHRSFTGRFQERGRSTPAPERLDLWNRSTMLLPSGVSSADEARAANCPTSIMRLAPPFSRPGCSAPLYMIMSFPIYSSTH